MEEVVSQINNSIGDDCLKNYKIDLIQCSSAQEAVEKILQRGSDCYSDIYSSGSDCENFVVVAYDKEDNAV